MSATKLVYEIARAGRSAEVSVLLAAAGGELGEQRVIWRDI
jgi:hypothetical protein